VLETHQAAPERQIPAIRRPGSVRLVSVVAPVFNEAALVGEFHRRVVGALSGVPFELVLVDDGSTDGTAEVLQALAAADRRVRVLSLSRNFGHQVALTAGLDHARGSAVVMLDADLQDPPELIPEMIERSARATTSSTPCGGPGQGRPRSSAEPRSSSTGSSGVSRASASSPSRAIFGCSTAGRSTRWSPCASAAGSCGG
jgi:glycosyltransferase involved in cell wall biosynthesis